MKLSGLFGLEKRLAYEFRDKGLLEEALRHSSFVNEQVRHKMNDNERLEFLGDAVLNLVVGHMLLNRFPNFDEGELSRMRSNIVNETRVASVAKSLDIGPYIQLGKGESLTKGREKNSILSNSFEAIIAAVYIDGGYDAAFSLIKKHFSFLLEPDGNIAAEYDYKTRIQELLQIRQGEKPIYSVIEEKGPDHNKIFRIELSVNDIRTEGYGKSKKHAEQDAARKALEILTENQNKSDGQ
jgi:ribonuclease III